jgi:hypothetical protein
MPLLKISISRPNHESHSGVCRETLIKSPVALVGGPFVG